MIDLIFISFFIALFCAGFVCGTKFGSAKAFVTAISDKVKSFFN